MEQADYIYYLHPAKWESAVNEIITEIFGTCDYDIR